MEKELFVAGFSYSHMHACSVYFSLRLPWKLNFISKNDVFESEY